MDHFQLSKEEIAHLKSLHRSLNKKKAAYRLHAIILLGMGKTPQEVSELLFIHIDTVTQWLKLYQEGGEDLLLTFNYKGGIQRMSTEQEETLKAWLDGTLVSTAKEVVTYIKSHFNLDYTPEGMVITLHRLGYSYKKTKIRPVKADPLKQEAFVKEYEELKSKLETDDRMYFMDGVHPTHNVMPSHAWIKTGTDREVKSNSGRQRVNINGVYSPQDHEVITVEADSVNSQSTIELFNKIEAAHPDAKSIYIIRDNARYYCSKLVKEYLETSRIKMVPLPSYSPNLNLIERLWKFFKKKVIRNRFYGSFDEFKGAVRDFFENIGSKQEEMTTLMTEKFHLFQGEVVP